MSRDFLMLGALVLVLVIVLFTPTFYELKRKFHRWRFWRKVGHRYKEDF